MLEPTTGTGSGGSSHDISVLNGLIETTIDSVDGYRRSAQEATNSRFSSEFLNRANEREQVVSQLRDAVRQLGGNPEDDGSVLAAAHRAFLSLKDKVTGADDTAIIGEVDHGETFLANKWEAALKDEQLSPQVRQIVQQGYDSVRQGRDTFRRMHEDMTGTSSGGSALFGGSGGSSSTGGGSTTSSGFATSGTSGTTGGGSSF
jgi:uncharacterized protein (TIGR02284 family)